MRTGTQVGSMAYMAPERFGNDEATSAVDVYALACVLCEALTGNTPFRTDSLEQVIGAHISAPPPRPSVINPRVPAALDDVVARGMAKQPDDRYGSAGAFGRAAARALTAIGSSSSAAETMAGPYAASGAPPNFGPHSGPQLAYSTGPTEIVAPQYGPPRGRWIVPTVIGVVGALLLGGIGIVIGMLAGRDNHPTDTSTPTTGSAPPSISQPQAQTPQSPVPQPAPPPSPGGAIATTRPWRGQQRQPRTVRCRLVADERQRLGGSLGAGIGRDVVLLRAKCPYFVLESVRRCQSRTTHCVRARRCQLPNRSRCVL